MSPILAMMSLNTAMMMLPGLIIGLSLHEFAHAWSASLLGDDFSRRQGRVSLNPLRHLSILGTLALFLIGFGWGKPVGVNLYNFKHPKRDYLITSLAGPLANVVVIIFCFALMQLTRHDYIFGASSQPYMLKVNELVINTAIINAILAAINLLPIPPLDGSKIWPCLIPSLKPAFGGKGMWIFIIGIILLMRSGMLTPVFNFVVESTYSHIPPSDSTICQFAYEGGLVAYNEQEYEDAVAYFNYAISINPRHIRSLQYRAKSRMGQGDITGALEDIERVIELTKASSKYSELCNQYIALRKGVLDAIVMSTSQPATQPESAPSEPE